jgi:hypothetical protein
MSSSRTIDKLAAAHFIRGDNSTGAFDIANDRASRIIHKLDAHLRNASTRTFFLIISLPYTKKSRYCARLRTGSAEDSGHLDELDGDFGGGIH